MPTEKIGDGEFVATKSKTLLSGMVLGMMSQEKSLKKGKFLGRRCPASHSPAFCLCLFAGSGQQPKSPHQVWSKYTYAGCLTASRPVGARTLPIIETI